MTREIRDNLSRLSKEVFGTSSRWQKILRNGVAQPQERDREVTVPDGKGGFKTKTFTDKKYTIQRFTTEEVVKLMMGILSQRNALVPKATETVDLGIPIGNGIPDGTAVV